MAPSAFADGQVDFQNNPTTGFYLYDYTTLTANLVTSATLGSQDGLGDSTGVLDVGLVWGTTAASVSTIYGGTLAGIEDIGPRPGILAGNASFTVLGTNPGDEDYFQVYAWDSSFGNSLAGLQACVAARGYFGAATAGFGNTTYGAVGAPLMFTLEQPPPSPGTPIFGTTGGYFDKTILLESPEPGTFALGGLGAAALLLFRRRK